jgi:hypothetical protein
VHAVPPAQNLVATPATKAAIRSAFVTSHGADGPGSKGPLAGRTYYARWNGKEYVLATFDLARTHLTDQPELFVRPPGGRWADKGDVGGSPPCEWAPKPVLVVWNLARGC